MLSEINNTYIPRIEFSTLFDIRQSAQPVYDESWQIVGWNKYPNIDMMYGPYNSVQEAFDALKEKVATVDSVVVGKTVGVIENGSIVEYWLKNATGSGTNGEYTIADLVKKNAGIAGGSDAVMTKEAYQQLVEDDLVEDDTFYFLYEDSGTPDTPDNPDNPDNPDEPTPSGDVYIQDHVLYAPGSVSEHVLTISGTVNNHTLTL